MEPFNGAKLAILVKDQIVTILRDDIRTIPYPNTWDLPGGGREGEETPEETVLRETEEELGLRLTPTDLHWRIQSPSAVGGHVWFFVSRQPEFDPNAVTFGDEGQEWRLATLDWFMSAENVIPAHQKRLKMYLNQHIKLM